MATGMSHYPFGTGVLYLIQINHQPDATIFQFIILTFVYSSTCFGPFPAHQVGDLFELYDDARTYKP
jgi:hypothetical protein